MDIDTLNLAETRKVIRIAIDSGANVCLEGDPGIGKSAMVGDECTDMDATMGVLIGSAMAPEDGALPVRNDATKTIERWILGPVAELNAQAKAGKRAVLFLDEITDTQRAVWSMLQRAINERYWMDEKLHDNLSIIMACNSAKIATGGQDLSWPVVGRISFVRVVPQASEVAEIFLSKLAPRTSGTFATLLADFGATLDIDPDLFQASPPEGAVEAQPWGVSRSWERGLKLMAKCMDTGEDPVNSKIIRALLIGSVGRDCANGYLALYAVRAQLPSMKEICADPLHAKLPGPATFAACAGVIAQVGQVDSHAGWTYAGRLADESKLVAGRILMRCPRGPASSPHASAGARARVQLEAWINKTQRVAA
jgi:hypothetical protein